MTEGAPAHGSPALLLPPTYKQMVSDWLAEDTPSFDYGGFVVGENVKEARLLGKSQVRAPVLSATVGQDESLSKLPLCATHAADEHGCRC